MSTGPSPEPSVAPGTLVLERYRIIRHIGQGGMGAVYEAVDERLKNTVALKQTLTDDEQILRAFEREAQLLAHLRHPALPKVIDHFVDTAGHFLVMEYIPGDDLAKLLEERRQPFPVDLVIEWTDQLLEVLHYLHTQSVPVIHRDIKPQNLKIIGGNQIVLLDFGLAKGSVVPRTGHQASSIRSTFGYTPQYAPIEQMQDAGTDARSDLYSLGGTIYCLVTGSPPPSALVRAGAVISQLPDPLRPAHEVRPDIPLFFSQVIYHAMALNPSDRPPSAEKMREQLRVGRLAHAANPEAFQTVVLPSASPPNSDPFLPNQTVQAQPPVAPVGMPQQPTIGVAQQAMPPSSLTAAGFPYVWGDQADANTVDLPQPVAVRKRSPWVFVAIGGGVLLLLLLLIVPSVLSNLQEEENGHATPTAAALQRQNETTENSENSQAVAKDNEEMTATAIQMETSVAATAQAQSLSQTATARETAIANFYATDTQARAKLHIAPSFDQALPNARSRFYPDMEALLLEQGYKKNITTDGGFYSLKPSQTGVPHDTWARDLDYAIRGYGTILGDMEVLQQNILLFLRHVKPSGEVPETIHAGNPVYGRAWDSMPNLIHATYGYVSKTGDREFYRNHRDALQRVGMWIVQLDSDGDGLPDRDDQFPYGYYNSIRNSVMHTYALAMFYASYRELAELERFIGQDGSPWEQRAAQLREAFHRPYDQGGYWIEGLPWPIAWRREESRDTLETFGVFEALQSGLIAPSDGERYRKLLQALHERLPEMLDGPTPMRLALGGYPEAMLRTDVAVPRWKLDASAPWIVGIAVPSYARAGYVDDAQTILQAYMEMARRNGGRVLQLAAGKNARFGPGEDSPRGLTWDTAAWFMAVYRGHYGMTMTPFALIVEPEPISTLPDDGISNLTYQGAIIQLSLDAATREYTLQSDKPIVVTFRPMGTAQKVVVNDEQPAAELTMLIEAGKPYRARSLVEEGH